MTIKELAVDHDYYASNSNYYSNEAGGTFDCWDDFIEEFGNADVDMNLCYRWDVREKTNDLDEPTGEYSMNIYIIGQRKGLYLPFSISLVVDSDVDSILKYLEKHYKKIKSIWTPISK